MKQWVYTQGTFKTMDIAYPGGDPRNAVEMETVYREMGFSQWCHLGDADSPLKFELYEHEHASQLESDVPYRFLIVPCSLYIGYEVFLPDLPDLLEFLRNYHQLGHLQVPAED